MEGDILEIKEKLNSFYELSTIQSHTTMQTVQNVDLLLKAQLEQEYFQSVILFVILLTYLFNSILKKIRF